jgi:hypothetical protein
MVRALAASQSSLTDPPSQQHDYPTLNAGLIHAPSNLLWTDQNYCAVLVYVMIGNEAGFGKIRSLLPAPATLTPHPASDHSSFGSAFFRISLTKISFQALRFSK